MLDRQNFQDIEERKSKIAFDLSQQKKAENVEKENDNPQNINQNKRESIIRLCNLDEVQDDVILGDKVVDFTKYKNDRMENGFEMLQQSYFKSKLSKGNDEKFEFKYYEKDDSHRMESVKEALQSYYSLMRENEPEYQNEEDRNNHQAFMAREKTQRLQTIVTNCNRYIANRWPISKEGRRRLKEVKELRREAIKELDEHAGHPGWRLAGEYFKFGLKAVTSPAWAPVAAVGTAAYYTGKWAGRVTKRIAKGTGKAIKRKLTHFADGVWDSFSSWKAFGATLLAIGATFTYGTLVNLLNTAIVATTIIPWLLASMVTVPRFYYKLAKGEVDLYGSSEKSGKRNVRCMAWSMPIPHRYSTWFKLFYYSGYSDKYIRPYGANAANNKAKLKKDEEKDIHLIYNEAESKRGGEYGQYTSQFMGPVRDVYFHSTHLKFKKFFELFRYSKKNDFNEIHERALQDYKFYEDYDEDVEEVQNKNNNAPD